jgi:hypothetical protein
LTIKFSQDKKNDAAKFNCQRSENFMNHPQPGGESR